MVIKLITKPMIYELLEDNLMEMQSMAVLQEEGTFKRGVLDAFIENFKLDKKNIENYLETEQLHADELNYLYNKTKQVLENYVGLTERPEEVYENQFLEKLTDKVTHHKKFDNFFHAIQFGLEKGEKDVLKLMDVVKSIASDLEPYEANFAVCYVAEELGIDMNTLENDFKF